jgi:RNA methyltransferase, TrmH family
MLSSPQNEHIKHLAKLRKDGKLRREQGHFLVEGPRFVKTALESSAEVQELVWSPNLAGEENPLVGVAEAQGVKVVSVSKDCYRKIADVKNPQGIAALVAMPVLSIGEVLASSGGLYLLACGVQDPGNLGAMIRCADAAGASAVLVVRPAADVYNSKVVRATAGSLLNIPVISLEETEVLGALAVAGVRVLLAEAGGDQDVRRADYSRPLALAVGSEVSGFSEAVRAAAKGSLRVPMWGRTESLNAAAAAALCLYAARWGDAE